ncbi:MAG: dihydroorotate dehydrogenase electron transfer subunit [Candidatus Zipacnadales bacterium]
MLERDKRPGIKDVEAMLQAKRPLSPAHTLLTFRAPGIAAQARAGHFVHVRVFPMGTSPLLRRPFSIAERNIAEGTIRILVRTVGPGTAALASLPPGAQLPLMGPLGTPFPDVAEGHQAILVAGGVGIAPLLCYAAQHRDTAPIALYGAKTETALVLLDKLEEHCESVLIATDDGTKGHRGFVTALLPEVLSKVESPIVLSCGPRPMMALVAAECRVHQVPCYVSFESWMGCGVGACLGCVIPAAGGPKRYVRVCRDGPVFNADEVDWDKLP